MSESSSSSSSSKPANKLETIKKAVHDFLHEKNAFTSFFELIEKYTKISREYIFIGKAGYAFVSVGSEVHVVLLQV